MFHNIEMGDVGLETSVPVLSREENSFFIDLIPGHPKLSFIEVMMSESWANVQRGEIGGLRKLNWLRQFKDFQEHNLDESGIAKYDLIFIDVGPSLGALNRSILLNTDYFVTPMGSDIFSILGLENIANWINKWIDDYRTGLGRVKVSKSDSFYNEMMLSHSINSNPRETTRFIGYSIQQYSKRKFKNGPRPVKSYEDIISEIPQEIEKHMTPFIKDNLRLSELHLGNVPYVYSLVPLSQTARLPICELNYASGLRGGQSASVDEYTTYIKQIAKNLLRNIEPAIQKKGDIK